MTKQPKPLLKISATLLNSWAYQFQCDDQYADDAKQSFLDYLNREPMEPNIYMKRGLAFEEICYEGGFARISNIIKDGAFQVYAEKKITVDGYDIMLVGYLDVLKEAVIYDIKRVNKYELQKYFGSYQHHVYFEIVPESKAFVYLIASGYDDDELELYKEIYLPEEKLPIEYVIATFYTWLKENGLFEIYEKNFQYEKEKEN